MSKKQNIINRDFFNSPSDPFNYSLELQKEMKRDHMVNAVRGDIKTKWETM